MEATATWMEEQVADDVNDNRQYLPSGSSADRRASSTSFKRSGWNQYGNWAFFEYLSSRYGVDLVRSIWNGAGAFEGGSPTGTPPGPWRSRCGHGGLPAVFARYAAGNTIPERVYPEGSAWPRAAIAADWTLSAGAPTRSTAYRIDHLSSRSTKIVPGSTLDAQNWQVRIAVDGPGQRSHPAAHLVTQRPGRAGDDEARCRSTARDAARSRWASATARCAA